jgi:hypothetical protein
MFSGRKRNSKHYSIWLFCSARNLERNRTSSDIHLSVFSVSFWKVQNLFKTPSELSHLLCTSVTRLTTKTTSHWSDDALPRKPSTPSKNLTIKFVHVTKHTTTTYTSSFPGLRKNSYAYTIWSQRCSRPQSCGRSGGFLKTRKLNSTRFWK